MDFEKNRDGTISFLAEALDAKDISTALAKFGIQVIGQDDALFDRNGKVIFLDFMVRGKQEDISFALDSIVKLIRPYPKGYIPKGRT